VLLEDGRLLHEGRITELESDHEVVACGKRRIDVDQLDLTSVILKEATHHELVVPPYEQVPPGRVRVAPEQSTCIPLASRTRLVDRLHGLERKLQSFNLVGLSVPFEANSHEKSPWVRGGVIRVSARTDDIFTIDSVVRYAAPADRKQAGSSMVR
jgi:hypothetical protein